MIQGEPVVAAANRQDMVYRLQQRIARANWEVMGARLLGAVCVFIVAGLLVAGLWPFHSPKNDVAWSAGGEGLHFGRHGTILSSGKYEALKARDDASCSIEVWLEPDLTDGSGTILAFYIPGGSRQFSVGQSVSDLALRNDIRVGRYRTRTSRLYVDDIFRRGKPLFITVTSNGGQTSVYIDGLLARTVLKFPLSGKDLEGELVIADRARVDNSWSGLLRGLAFYDQELSPAQVLQHYQAWTKNGRPNISENERALALYLFDEHAGDVIHNQVSSRPALHIPERYVVLDEVFLEPFWEEFHLSWSYFNDVLVNIGGFVPFGFLCCAYFSLARRFKRPALAAVILGFMISLTIECLQAFLPTRDSGTTDLFTNTLGTYLGVWAYRLTFWRALSARIWANLMGISGNGQEPSKTI